MSDRPVRSRLLFELGMALGIGDGLTIAACVNERFDDTFEDPAKAKLGRADEFR